MRLAMLDTEMSRKITPANAFYCAFPISPDAATPLSMYHPLFGGFRLMKGSAPAGLRGGANPGGRTGRATGAGLAALAAS